MCRMNPNGFTRGNRNDPELQPVTVSNILKSALFDM